MPIKDEHSVIERFPVPSAWSVFTGALKFTFLRIGILMFGNLLWLLTSLPIITMPAASMGLYHLVYLLVENPEPEREAHWRDFFKGFRLYWMYGTKTIAINLVIGSILVTGFLFYLNHDADFTQFLVIPTLACLVFWLLIQLYLMPLVFFHEQVSVKLAFTNSALLCLHFPGYTFTLTVFLLLVAALGIVLAGPVLVILISFLFVCQYLATKNAIMLLKEKKNHN